MFEVGNRANPNGRPKGSVSGRAKAVQLVDAICADENNLRLLKKAMQEEFEQNPMGFFRNIIVPLAPKITAIDVDGDFITKTLAQQVKEMVVSLPVEKKKGQKE